MKLAPVDRALRSGVAGRNGVGVRIVHTGQHYDTTMDRVFFDALGIPEPEVHLAVGSGSHGAQTARILERYEEHLQKAKPAATIVFGDVNSTVACSLAAVKLGIPVVHVEAGLRSFDRTMPEEVNRVLTDAVADLLLVSEPSGVANLLREGIDDGKVHLVGNVMIDTLARELPEARRADVAGRFGLPHGDYGLVTLHRPSNVDDPAVLERLLRLLVELSRGVPMVFPVHPRTRARMDDSGLSGILDEAEGVRCTEPLGYRENLSLMEAARVVLTDSGGMQEETTFLRVPCLTLRETTERPVTVEKGTSRLVGSDPERIRAAFVDVMAGRWPEGEAIPLWDGHAAERVAAVVWGQPLN